MAFGGGRSEAVAQSVKSRRRTLGAVSALGAVIACAGCAATNPAVIATSHTVGATVAFESIDGLPEGQFHKLVQALSDEASARQVIVVSRAGAARYRVRGYAAAHVHGRRTSVAWLWDVYDSSQQRMLRISGEQQTVTRHKGWAAVDDHSLRDIARTGMAQLAAFLAAPGAPAQPDTPGEPRGDGLVVAVREEFSPELARIFRVSQTQSRDAAMAAPAGQIAAKPVPVPKSRPRLAGLAGLAIHAARAHDVDH